MKLLIHSIDPVTNLLTVQFVDYRVTTIKGDHMPSILTNTRYQAFATVALIVVFAALGLWYGTPPDSANAATFGDVLKAFARDQQTKTILVAIVIDVVTGVAAGMRTGTFDGQKVAAFMGSNVLPYGLGYMLFWYLSYFGLNDLVLPEIASTISNTGFGLVMSALTVSNLDNVTRAYAGSARPADIDEPTATPLNTRG